MARRSAIIGLALVTLLAACRKQGPSQPSVDHAWVRLPAVAGRPGAAYFTIHGGSEPARLVALSSPAVQSVELHQSMKGGTPPGAMAGMMQMARIAGVDVPAGSSVAFAPGGYHAMLFGIDPKLVAGGTLPLVFRFAQGRPIARDARAVGAGAPAP